MVSREVILQFADIAVSIQTKKAIAYVDWGQYASINNYGTITVADAADNKEHVSNLDGMAHMYYLPHFARGGISLQQSTISKMRSGLQTTISIITVLILTSCLLFKREDWSMGISGWWIAFSTGLKWVCLPWCGLAVPQFSRRPSMTRCLVFVVLLPSSKPRQSRVAKVSSIGLMRQVSQSTLTMVITSGFGLPR